MCSLFTRYNSDFAKIYNAEKKTTLVGQYKMKL